MPAAKPRVRLETSHGEIVLELDSEQAPLTVDNFLNYVRNSFYDGTVFHRVIPGFMIQGGGLDADLKPKKTRPPVKNEAHRALPNTAGTVAMARTQEVDSATSQFFINTADNAFLDHAGESAAAYGYTAFGRVMEGMETVRAIEAVPTGSKGMHRDVPVATVVIERATELSV
jgi:cyclophilin family peptidyl-prolyl cis-trans isomerase